MIEQSAKVLRTQGDEVAIEVRRQTACGSCSAKAGCGKSLLDNVFKIKPLLLTIPNTIGARENDDVIVGLNESAILQASFYLYFFPLFMMMIFAIAAGYLLSNQNSEIFTIVAAVIGLLAGSRMSSIILNRKEKNKSEFFQPTLIKIIPKMSSINLVSKNS